MMHQQNTMAIRMKHQRSAGDVAGMELVAREGSASIFEQSQNQARDFLLPPVRG